MGEKKEKIGVYVCHCGTNISQTVDIDKVVEYAKTLPNVVAAKEYKYMCSDPGQDLIKKDIKELGLTRVVVSSCSPLMHEITFRHACEDAGLNQFLFQMSNIREQCSWVTADKEKATIKAKKLIAAAVKRVIHQEPLEIKEVPVNPATLVVGGGITGIEAALQIANAGKTVYLVEKDPTIGGHMAQFDKTFPTLDCAACILTPKMVSVGQHPNIKLLTYSEVKKVNGYVGNYKVTINKKSRYVDENECTGCAECMKKCPVKMKSEFEEELTDRKAIYIPFPQAVPQVPVIDKSKCLKLTKNACGNCQKACGAKAINFDMKDEEIEVEVGAIIIATGYDLFDKTKLERYGYGKMNNVLTSLEFERYTHASGPTGGKVVLKDGSTPKSIAILHCIGSRDENYNEYCSRVCCMYSLKFAHLAHEKTGAEVHNFYIDIRAFGKGYEEFYKRCMQENTIFIRGKGAEVTNVAETEEEKGKLIVKCEDTLLGQIRRIPVEMVILSMGLVPRKDSGELAKIFSLNRSKDGFFLEKHPKLAPVSTASDGIYIAGACQGPKDIPDSVAQGAAAAANVLSLISAGKVHLEPITSVIDEKLCSGCKLCISMCPYLAIEFDEKKKISKVVEALCKGCGTCVATCPSGNIQQKGYTDKQIYEEIEGTLELIKN